MRTEKKPKPKPRHFWRFRNPSQDIQYLQQKRMHGYITVNESFAVHIDLSELYITNAWQKIGLQRNF